MLNTFRMILMNYREVVYLIFMLGALWGAGLTIGIRMYIKEVKHDRRTTTNKEI